MSSGPSSISRGLPIHTPGSVVTLPSPLTSFVGRADELAALTALVTDPAVRLITIIGPGGIGKTRLTIHLSHKVQDRFPEGVIFIGLANIRDPGLLFLAVANALGVTDLAERSWTEQLWHGQRHTRLLLVLDNLEHLLNATPILAEILEHAPGITMLATSRTRLNLSGEHIYTVPPLAETDAVALFEQRARALVPDFSIQPDSSADIADICRRLDGLPLAIELAAARTPVLPPNAMRARLNNRMAVLARGPRDAPARHQGMREAIAWSYELLNCVEQVLFRRLAVFDGGFTLEAAGAVTGMSSDILDGIASLEASSLLKIGCGTNGQPRFRMLETIREFAIERLNETGEGDAMLRAHANYFVQMADGTERVWWRPEGLEKVDQVEAEVSNIRAALTWMKEVDDVDSLLQLAGSLAPLWASRGYSQEGRAWLEWGLPRADDHTTPSVILATRALSWILNLHGDYYRSLLLANHVRTLSAANPDRLNIVNSFNLSGIAAQKMGLPEMAIAYLRSALDELTLCTGDAWAKTSHCIALNVLGGIALDQGDIDAAEGFFTQSLVFQQEFGLRFTHGGHANKGLGEVARAQGDPLRAMRHYEMALRDSTGTRDVRTIAYLLGGIAGALAILGKHQQAARLFGASEIYHEQIAMPFHSATFDRQRALGLPEPWASPGVSHGVSQPLYVALASRTAAIRSVEIDPGLARQWWDQGRHLSVAEAIDLALAEDPNSHSNRSLAEELSLRELEVLRLIAVGSSNQEIGGLLSISTRTVENHVHSILAKLDLPSRTAAAAHAIRNGLA